MPAHVIEFISRKDLLARRGARNFGRFMSVNKGLTPHNGLTHLEWQAEAREDQRQDAAWAKRHGPVEGGASVGTFPPSPEPPTQKRRRLAERR